jgi:hypothetical protein
MESKVTFEEDKRIASLASDMEFYKKEALEAVRIPPQYFGGCDPYEDNSTSKVIIFKKLGNVYESILNKLGL